MYVSIPVVIILSLIAALTTWFIGTRNMDFTQPPTPEQYIEITEEWEKNKPRIAPANITTASSIAGDHTEAALPSRIDAAPLPLIDFGLPPSLSEFDILRDKGAGHLILLARHLESTDHPEHALLAWERVIDTADPGPEEHRLALGAIKNLKSDIAPWNPDPAASIALELRAGASIKDASHLHEALITTARKLSESSGQIIRIEAHLSLGENSQSLKSPVPVAIWLSRKASKNDSTPAETVPVSFMADTGTEGNLIAEIEAGVYDIVRAQLAKATGFSKLPERTEAMNPDDLIRYYITRLMWREFANSLTP